MEQLSATDIKYNCDISYTADILPHQAIACTNINFIRSSISVAAIRLRQITGSERTTISY